MRNRTKYGSVAAALVSALLLAACSSSGQSSSNTSSSSSTANSGVAPSASTVDVNVGTSAPVKLSTGKLKIGIFMNGMTNGWEQALSACV
jgi:PBP1b-binding outer membrane lipoprotein LpoB